MKSVVGGIGLVMLGAQWWGLRCVRRWVGGLERQGGKGDEEKAADEKEEVKLQFREGRMGWDQDIRFDENKLEFGDKL